MSDAANTGSDESIAGSANSEGGSSEAPSGKREGVHRRPFSGAGPFIIIILLTLVGLFATGYLSYRHIALTAQIASMGDSPLCRSDGKINCDGVLLTDQATLYEYVPSTALGLMGFVFAFWCAINGLINSKLRKDAWALLLIYFFGAIAFTWYFMYLMMFKMEVLCSWCLVVHAVNFVALAVVVIVSVKKRKEFAAPDIASHGERAYFFLGGVTVALLSFFVSGMVEQALCFEDARSRYESIANDPVVLAAQLKAAPSVDIPITPEDPVFGFPDAPHTIVFFGDFECPVCPKMEQFLRMLVIQNQKTLKMVYKSFPLSTTCNKSLLDNTHPMSCQAAQAAYSAFLLGGSSMFFQYGDMLKANKKLLKEEPWVFFAKDLKLDVNKFGELLGADSPARRKINEDIKLGNKLALNATPTMFFDNKRIPYNVQGLFLVGIMEDIVRINNPEMKDFKIKMDKVPEELLKKIKKYGN